MANYLHDYVGQALAMCKLKVDLLSKGRGSVEEINALLLQALDHTRSVTFDLSPPVLRELNFTGAIEWLTVQFQHQHHIPLAFESDGQAFNLDEDLKTFLYHAVRELLTNVIKHSHAANAAVSLRSNDSSLIIRVEDDGVGPSYPDAGDQHLKGGFGLFNIKERMLYYGGTFEMRPRADRGTSVVLTVPLEEIRR
jgi:signal transduction histidine kinase